MSKITTAFDYIENNKKSWETEQGSEVIDNTEELLIEFAKLHVEAALKEASKKAEAKNGPGEWSYLYVDENSIINSYPLTNII